MSRNKASIQGLDIAHGCGGDLANISEELQVLIVLFVARFISCLLVLNHEFWHGVKGWGGCVVEAFQRT